MRTNKPKIEAIQKQLLNELNHAFDKFDKFNTPHEGYAVILEELDELWEAIKQNKPTNELTIEAYHIAAMAIRFLHDLCHIKHE